MNNFKNAVSKAAKGLLGTLPLLLGVILLISLATALIPKSAYTMLFTGNYILDSFVGAVIGSVLAGNPITSYIIGGELLSQGVSLLAITSFLVAWVTVGIVQLPAESMLLGKRFALVRNLTAFFFSILVAVITVVGVGLL